MSLAVAAGRPSGAQCWLCCNTLPAGSPPPSTAGATSGHRPTKKQGVRSCILATCLTASRCGLCALAPLQDSVFLPMAFLPHFGRFLFLRGVGWSLQSPAQQNGRQQLRPCAEQHRAAERPCKHSLPLLSVQDLFAGLSQCKTHFQPSCLLAQGVGKLTMKGKAVLAM